MDAMVTKAGITAKTDRDDSIGTQPFGIHERLLSAQEVAQRLGVSERFVRDHATRRSPKIRGIKLGSLLRFRWRDVETFISELETLKTSRNRRFGV